MQVTKIRGSYRVIDDEGNYRRYSEEEYQALFGNSKQQEDPALEEDPLDSDDV